MSEKLTREQIEGLCAHYHQIVNDHAALEKEHVVNTYAEIELAQARTFIALCDLALAGLEVQQRLSNRIKALEDDGKQRTAVGDALLAELKILSSLPEPK